MSESIKKNNHQVTRSLLENWQTNRGENSVIWSFDVTKQEKKFFQGPKASFAIFEYLYAPLQEDGRRNDDLENEFAVDEGCLAQLIRAANGRSERKPSDQTLEKGIRSCVSLGFRSAYYTYHAMSLLSQHGVDSEDLHREAIAIMRKTLQAKYEQFANWKFVIITGLKEDLLINEQPFRDWTVHKDPHNFISMTLGPRAILFGAPSADGRFSVEWTDDNQSRVNVANHNKIAVNTTRHFIVAASEAQLDAVQPLLTPELVRDRMATDRVVTASLLSSSGAI